MTHKRRGRLECERLEERQLLSGYLDLTSVEWRTIDGTHNNLANPTPHRIARRTATEHRPVLGRDAPAANQHQAQERPERPGPQNVRGGDLLLRLESVKSGQS
jgi:hypothetical protein